MLGKEELITYLEEALFMMPTESEEIDELEIPGVRGRSTPFSHPYANIVGQRPDTGEVSNHAIEKVLGFFRVRHQAFGWVVGPHSSTALAGQLTVQGLDKIQQFSGMALTDMGARIHTRPGVRIVEVRTDEQEAFSGVLSRSEGLPRDVADFMSRVLYFNPRHLKVRNYFAYLHGVDEPVGLGSSIFFAERPVVLFAGASVLEPYRHHGAYRGLLSRRLEDAREEGSQAALIQADRATSAPICEKMGFEAVCRQELYAWDPETAA